MTSDARAFFETHRALFEYDKYFPGRDPCTSSSSGLLFAHLGAPSSSASSSSFADAIAALNASVAPSIAFKPPPPTSAPTTYWTKPVVAQPSRPIARPYEPRPHYIRESSFPPPMSQQPVAQTPLPLQPALPLQSVAPAIAIATLPSTTHESSSKANVAPTKELSRKASSASTLPRGLQLLDSSVRAYTRKVDMAQKIEMLVGPKFGRVFGPSSNLPVGVKRRLEAYARLDQRKEALYQLLLSEQQALDALRHTRNH